MIVTARIFALALSLAAAGSAAAEPAPAARELGEGVVWKSKPSADDISRYYPEDARGRNQAGWALLRCRVTAEGRMEACRAPASSPQGAHFDDMALKLAPKFRMAPATADGRPVAGGLITIPITLVAGPSGGKLPPESFQVTRASVALTPADGGKIPCPDQARPDRMCKAHRIDWADAPPLHVAGPLIAATGPARGTANLECTVRGDALVDCSIGGETVTPAMRDAMLALAQHFKAPKRAEGGLPLEGRKVLVVFDWTLLSRIYGAVYGRAGD